MTPHFTLKRKYFVISESTANDTGVVENVLDSPTKQMRMECPINDEHPINTSIRESCPISTNLDKEEENEVLVILIPRDEDTTAAGEVEKEAETAFTTDSESKDLHLSHVHNDNDSEGKESPDERTETAESEGISALLPYPNEFYCGSGSPSSSRSPSPPIIFLIPFQSQAGPSDLSNIHQDQQQEDSATPQLVPETMPLPISSHFNPPRPSSPHSASVFEALQTLSRKYRPSPSPSRRSLYAIEPSEFLDEPEDINGDEDEDFDLIRAMIDRSASTPADVPDAGDHQPQYPIYIEEIDLPWFEGTTITHDEDGDGVAVESQTILTRIQGEEEEDPEARLKRLVREGEMESDDGTQDVIEVAASF
ncbi:hypothetical protein Clacol_003161 [Clathrus columnatus]|uniref:Uncharacterized protein n=1 Tax=Clathrus columnatus TaxID=1419009 RepID=A0AAV5A2P7_9AGAM|nr:hypothetical protein Clacol_003161 [Clathrus columnatus]